MEHFRFFVLIGRTGCGKTRLLRSLKAEKFQVLDLEDIAGHRGSAFGAVTPGAQRLSQPEFLEALALKFSFFDHGIPIITEWKGRTIGSLKVPDFLYNRLLEAPKILIERSTEARIQELLEVYRNLSVEALYQALFSLRPKLGEKIFELALHALKEKDRRGFVKLMLAYYDRSPEYAVSIKRIVNKIVWKSQSVGEIALDLNDCILSENSDRRSHHR